MNIKIKCIFKYALSLLLHYSGTNKYILKKSNKLYILMFHRLNDEVDYLHMSISSSDFRKVISWVKEFGDIISLDAALKHDFKKNNFCLTFDDGYENVKKLPKLIPGVPVTLYLSTAFIGENASFWAIELQNLIMKYSNTLIDLTEYSLGKYYLNSVDEREKTLYFLNNAVKNFHPDIINKIILSLREQVKPNDVIDQSEFLNWKQVNMLVESGVEIGAHTHNHVIVSKLSASELRNEIDLSNNLITNNIGTIPAHFAYPNGRAQDISDLSREILIDSGYKSAVTTIEGANELGYDVFRLYRFNIDTSRIINPFGKASKAMLTTLLANSINIK